MAAITRLSLDGYGAKRTGSFAGKESSEAPAAPAESVAAAAGYKFRPGYIRPRRLKKRKQPPITVEVAVERQEVKYVAVQQQEIFGPSLVPVMQAVDEVTRLIETRAKVSEIQRKIEELEEEEDIIVILSQLQ